jgi:hypothetical protein
MKTFDTLSETMTQLCGQGYGTDMNTLLPTIRSEPAAFTVDAVYRFEGPTDPGDALILYAISSPKHNLKGMLTNAFGMYADADTAGTESLLDLPDRAIAPGAGLTVQLSF